MTAKKEMTEWRKYYTWVAYVQPHFRYGALIYQEPKGEMIKENSKFNRFRQIYNKSLKETLNLPY